MVSFSFVFVHYCALLVCQEWSASVVTAIPLLSSFTDDYEYEDYNDYDGYAYDSSTGPITGALMSYRLMCYESSFQISLKFYEGFWGYLYPLGKISECRVFRGRGMPNVTLTFHQDDCGYEDLLKGNGGLVIQWDPVFIQDSDIEIEVGCVEIQATHNFNATQQWRSHVRPEAAMFVVSDSTTPKYDVGPPKSLRAHVNESLMLFVVVRDPEVTFVATLVRKCFAFAKNSGQGEVTSESVQLIRDDRPVYPHFANRTTNSVTNGGRNGSTAVKKFNFMAFKVPGQSGTDVVLRCHTEVCYHDCDFKSATPNPLATGNRKRSVSSTQKRSVMVEASCSYSIW